MPSDYLSSTLVFNGKRYKIDKWFPTKAQAQKYADYVRSKGALARIVSENDGGYSVFRRGKLQSAKPKKRKGPTHPLVKKIFRK